MCNASWNRHTDDLQVEDIAHDKVSAIASMPLAVDKVMHVAY